jgi:hypothetical protein
MFMSWVLLVSVAILLAAIVVTELRAIRTGDERKHHGPGYAFVLGGLVLIVVGIAAAMGDQDALALISSATGLLLVVVGASRHPAVHGPTYRGHQH